MDDPPVPVGATRIGYVFWLRRFTYNVPEL